MLERLLPEGLSPREFLRRHWAQVPYSTPGGCGDLVALGSWAVVEGILERGGADVLVSRGGEKREGPPPGGAEGRALFEEGWTLGIRHAEAHDAGLRDLADAFAEDLGGPVDVHVYATPAGRHGFGWHYDAEEVFVLQAQGAKEFALRKNTVNPLPVQANLPEAMDVRQETSPLQMACLLEAGDWLYVPGGWWHAARARTDAISIAVGVTAPTALDVLRALEGRLLGSVVWRQRLPVAGRAAGTDEAEARRHHEALFARLGAHLARELADPEFLRQWLSRPPSP